VKDVPIVEIDTRFFPDYNGNGHRDSGEEFIDGLGVVWIDTLGASNSKWSYYAPQLHVNHEAHVEGVETGYHQIQIPDQPGCTVGLVHIDNIDQDVGPQTVTVQIKSLKKDLTVFVDVACVQ
jgi:hypothetical protein